MTYFEAHQGQVAMGFRRRNSLSSLRALLARRARQNEHAVEVEFVPHDFDHVAFAESSHQKSDPRMDRRSAFLELLTVKEWTTIAEEIQRTRAEMEAAGIEFTRPIHSSELDNWSHF